MTNFESPIGRIVMGHCFNPQPMTEQRLIRTGPNAGKPRTIYFIGVAINKDNPGCKELIKEIKQVAMSSFPKLFDENGKCRKDDFSFKIIDGDSDKPNQDGKIPKDRPGFPGCYVFRFTTGFQPKVINNTKSEITDVNAIKRGYYVRVAGTIKSNEQNMRPGIYLNHHCIQLMGYGEEIVGNDNLDKIFNSEPAYFPPEMQREPVVSVKNDDYMNAKNNHGLNDVEMRLAELI